MFLYLHSASANIKISFVVSTYLVEIHSMFLLIRDRDFILIASNMASDIDVWSCSFLLNSKSVCHLAWSEVTMPALDMEMDCCSMASCMEVRSWSFILSNSSIRHTPLSANTSAPASSVHSLRNNKKKLKIEKNACKKFPKRNFPFLKVII